MSMTQKPTPKAAPETRAETRAQSKSKRAESTDYKSVIKSRSSKSNSEYTVQELPTELRHLVRRVVKCLGDVICEFEGQEFFNKIESFRERLKQTRGQSNKPLLLELLKNIKTISPDSQLKIAHAFSLQLELINTCETAYRTWRLRSGATATNTSSQKINLTYVLTAHPTEARSKVMVHLLNDLQTLLQGGMQSELLFNQKAIASKIRLLWLHSFSKKKSPTVLDEADSIFSRIFSTDLFDFLLTEKESYEINLRTWVGGDKDGHPYVNSYVMQDCLQRSRKYILNHVSKKISTVLQDLDSLETEDLPKTEQRALLKLKKNLESLKVIKSNDGNRVLKWRTEFLNFVTKSSLVIKKHEQVLLIQNLFKIFPAFVFPIELREDSGLIAEALNDKKSVILAMLKTLSKISGSLGVPAYAKGFIISHCESSDDIKNALELTVLATGTTTLPTIPLFETREALETSSAIIAKWLSDKKNLSLVRKSWNGKLEIMLGYSDSAKEAGALSSRYLIAHSMVALSEQIKSYGLTPKFFHGSGGSVARGGGSLKDQIAWWATSAIEAPKSTVQGEMIQRQFATKEILNSQCLHMAIEAEKRQSKGIKIEDNPHLKSFVQKAGAHYAKLVQDTDLLTYLLNASPYRYLNVLKIGSRPSKRPDQNTVTTASLRAIPWVLCWTQTRVLMPAWWGVGSAWKESTPSEKTALKRHYQNSPFLASFVKTLGYTLAKVELDIWELYFENYGEAKNKQNSLFTTFRNELECAKKFVLELSEEKSLIWHKPWLQESIDIRSATIHILNCLQVLALENQDEELLKETLVGIACGMQTTG